MQAWRTGRLQQHGSNSGLTRSQLTARQGGTVAILNQGFAIFGAPVVGKISRPFTLASPWDVRLIGDLNRQSGVGSRSQRPEGSEWS